MPEGTGTLWKEGGVEGDSDWDEGFEFDWRAQKEAARRIGGGRLGTANQ
jgi:hypothetical protein